jgi:two-component sensor histidine kinase
MFFNKLINLGIEPSMDFYQKRETRVINLFATITLFGLFIGISTVFFISGSYAVASVIFTTITSLLSLFFNYKKLYNYSSYLFILSINITIFVLCQQYDYKVGNYLYFFPLIFCIALIHNPKLSSYRSVIFFLITLCSFIGSLFIDITSLKNTSITESDNTVLLIYNSVLAFIITIILVYLVIKLINQQNNEVLTLLEKQQTAQKSISQSLKEKDIMLAEIQHRVKNNLAIISGLLNLQLEKAPCDVSKKLMTESKNRVMSISMVHDRLYRKDNLSKIDLKLYLSELTKEIIKSFPINNKEINIEEDLDTVTIELTKAVPIGLIINEIITNCIKHAFHNTSNPFIKLKMKIVYDRIHLSLSDNGPGFPDNSNLNDASLGLSLIESLSDQIDAKVAFRTDNGACVSIVFPI